MEANIQLLIILKIKNWYSIIFNWKVPCVSYNINTVFIWNKQYIKLLWQHIIFINWKYKKSMSTMSTKTD